MRRQGCLASLPSSQSLQPRDHPSCPPSWTGRVTVLQASPPSRNIPLIPLGYVLIGMQQERASSPHPKVSANLKVKEENESILVKALAGPNFFPLGPCFVC